MSSPGGEKQEDGMEGSGKPRMWVNRIVAFLGGGLVVAIVLSIALVGPVNSRNKALKTELDEIQNGAPRLLAEAKAFAEGKDYDNALKTLDVLFVQQPASKEAIEGKKLYATIEATVRDSNMKWEGAMTSIRKAWEKTTAAQLREQGRAQVESDMAETLKKEWEKVKDQIRKAWEQDLQLHPAGRSP
jgi:hypothetical protein